MKRNVAIYARVSTEHEAQLSVLDNQVQYYDDILKKNPDWILYDRYIDEDITGTSTKKRKKFMRMIEDAKSERFDLIVIREVSRFARNTVDTLQETRKLKNIGVEVYFIDDNISNYNRFIDAFENSTIFFSLDEKEKKIINYVYDFYIKILNIIVCKDTEKQLFDTILNIPFIIDAFEDNSVKESFNEILKKFDKQGEFNNISILKVLISKKDIDMLQKFSDIIRHIKHFKVTNLNSSEGCQLLVTADKRIECKIVCLPSQSYELYMYYNKEHFIDIIAFSFDFDQKEYASNIYGFKYSNNKDKSKPANINLSNFINIK